jgi:di/tricarboxylate transporter
MEMGITFGVLVVMLAALILELTSADVVFMAGLAIVCVTGVIPLETALEGFANGTLVALGSLYVVAAALQRTGALARVARFILGEATRVRVALVRLIVPVSIGSAFLNNTPIVAMGIPAVRTWARSRELSAAKLLMPLSYASIFGGMCTLMGTSTNLVVHGMLQTEGQPGYGFFELAGIGIPCTLAGWLYLVFVVPWSLGDRHPSVTESEEEGEQPELVQLEIEQDADWADMRLEDSGLAELPGLRLRRIERDGETIEQVDDDTVIGEGDRLFYVPDPDTTAETFDPEDFPGLKLQISSVEALEEVAEGHERHSVMVRHGSRLVGRRLGDTGFERKFGVRVQEVRRSGDVVDADDPRDIRVKAGDTLIVRATGRDFRRTFEDSPELYVTTGYTSDEQEQATRQTWRQTLQMALVVSVLLAIVGLTVSGSLDIALAALLGAVTLVGARVISPAAAREAIDWEVLLVIGAALGLGQALQASGGAELLGRSIVGVARPVGPFALLAAIVVGTTILTEVITNNGAVALFFPIALSIAESEGIDPRPLIVGMTAAGSMSLMTPFGYQTNLMIYSAGDYRFADFPKTGGPLQLLFIGIVIAVVPLIWGF